MEEKLNISGNATWPERYSDKAFKLFKQGLIIFLVILLVSTVVWGLEMLLILPFLLFLYTFVLGIISLVGLLLKTSTRRYYIQSILTVIVSFTLILLHFYAGYQLVRSQKITKIIAKRIICGTNLKQLSSAMSRYETENQRFPVSDKWCDEIQHYWDEMDMYFLCPVNKTGPCSYAMNENIPADANELPGDLVLLFESAPGWNQTGGPDDVVTDRHGNTGVNIAFADGHVEFIDTDKIPALRWTIEYP